MEPAYTYSAHVVRWVDGDTVDCVIDLGFHTSAHQRLRLYGIDTPERGKPGYLEAIRFCEDHAPAGSKVVVQTYATPEKYGRFLALIQVDQTILNQALVEAGHAKSYFGGTKLS